MMHRLVLFAALVACVASLPQALEPIKDAPELVQAAIEPSMMSPTQMEKGMKASEEPVEIPVKIGVAASVPAQDKPAPKAKKEFTVMQGADCKNRKDIMSALYQKASLSDCKAKCGADDSCTGYVMSEDGECTVLKGSCEKSEAKKLTLFIVEGAIAVPKADPAAPPAPIAATAAAPPSDTMLDLTVVIPTVRRYQSDGTPAPERYLAPMVHKLVADLTPEQQKHVNIVILNADKEPEKHEEALSLASLPGVQIVTRPNREKQMSETLKNTGAIRENGEVYLEDGRQVNKDWVSWVAAEDLDGAYLLELGMKKSPYVLFIEDDVWPTTKALPKLSKFVQGLQNDDWLFIDLYTPNLNWAPGMLDFKNGEKYPFECCTQAMLFRADRLGGIINYWRQHAHEPVDDNLRNYRKNVVPNLNIYAARPNLFEHIGAYSSNPQKSKGVVEHQSIEFVPLLFQTEAVSIATH